MQGRYVNRPYLLVTRFKTKIKANNITSGLDRYNYDIYQLLMEARFLFKE